VGEDARDLLEPIRDPVERLAGAGLEFGTREGRLVRLPVRGGDALLSVPDDFDAGPALAGRRKSLGAVETKLEQSEGKLSNQRFLERANPEAVERERRKHADLEAEAAALREQIALLEQL
jgi:valyl-tRNA synthetase